MSKLNEVLHEIRPELPDNYFDCLAYLFKGEPVPNREECGVVMLETLRQCKWWIERGGFQFAQVMNDIDTSLSQVLGNTYPPPIHDPDERVKQDRPPSLFEDPAGQQPVRSPAVAASPPPLVAAPNRKRVASPRIAEKVAEARKKLDETLGPVAAGGEPPVA